MRNVLKRLSVLMLAVFGLQACSLFNSEEDVVKMAPVPKVESRFELDTLWRRSVGDGVGDFFSQLAPALAGDRLFAAARDGQVRAFDKKKGEVLWSRDLSDLPLNEQKRSPRLAGGVTAAEGALFIGSENGDLYALSQESGDLLWVSDVPGEVLAAPAVDAGRVVVVTTSGKVVAYDTDKGERLWASADDQPNLTLRGVAKPVIAAGGVLYGRADGRVSILLLENGQLVNASRVTTARGATELDRMVDVDAAPVIVGDELYTIAYHGQLVARKLMTGDEVWKRSYSAYEDLAVGATDLVITDSNGHVFSVARDNGRERWSNNQLENRKLTPPLVYDGYVLVGDGEGYLYWLDDADGHIVSMQRIDSDGLYVAPVADGDILYLQTRSGRLVALKRN